MAFCKKCGATMPDGVPFCNACGAEMNSTDSSTQQSVDQGYIQQNNASQQDYTGQTDFSGQQGYSNQQGNPGQQGYSNQQGNPGQQGYSNQQGNPGQQGYSNQQGNPGQQGYSNQQGNPGQQNSFNPQDAFNSAMNFANNTQDTTGQYDPNDIMQNKGISAVAYVPILFFIPLVAKPDSKFGRYHANQGLCFTIASIIVAVCSIALTSIFCAIFRSEVMVWGIGTGTTVPNGFALLLCAIVRLAQICFSLFFLITGIMNAVNGKAKELPIIGKFKLVK